MDRFEPLYTTPTSHLQQRAEPLKTLARTTSFSAPRHEPYQPAQRPRSLVGMDLTQTQIAQFHRNEPIKILPAIARAQLNELNTLMDRYPEATKRYLVQITATLKSFKNAPADRDKFCEWLVEKAIYAHQHHPEKHSSEYAIAMRFKDWRPQVPALQKELHAPVQITFHNVGMDGMAAKLQSDKMQRWAKENQKNQ